jgi:hypothetical protein
MKESEVEKSILEELKGRQLSAVTFVQDYVQLQFDGPYLNFFVWPQVMSGGRTCGFGQPGYRDALCDLIAKVVGGVFEEAGRKLRFFFTDDSIVEVSLLLEARRGPEAVVFQNGDGAFRVW